MAASVSDGGRWGLACCPSTGCEALLAALRADGYKLIGPRVRDGAIVHDDISGVADLPAGWGEEQEAGRYRLVRRDDQRLFGFSVGPQSWKPSFFAPRVRLTRLRRKNESFEADPVEPDAPRVALIGARACDLAAIAVQDRTFVAGPLREPDYVARRRDVFVVGVNCGQAGGTCFCVSMNTGPRVTQGHDLALTELDDPHRFVVEVGERPGPALLDRAGRRRAAVDGDRAAADGICEATARSMGRTLDTSGIKELLYRNQEHPRWDDVAARCLGCTNCTLACPTCFCSTVEDIERSRRRDGGALAALGLVLHAGALVRPRRQRPRVHQGPLPAVAHPQAGELDRSVRHLGCVGCGRCITWCPVGIDITEEVAAIRASDGARPA